MTKDARNAIKTRCRGKKTRKESSPRRLKSGYNYLREKGGDWTAFGAHREKRPGLEREGNRT